jgi:hypothetical protein
MSEGRVARGKRSADNLRHPFTSHFGRESTPDQYLNLDMKISAVPTSMEATPNMAQPAPARGGQLARIMNPDANSP